MPSSNIAVSFLSVVGRGFPGQRKKDSEMEVYPGSLLGHATGREGGNHSQCLPLHPFPGWPLGRVGLLWDKKARPYTGVDQSLECELFPWRSSTTVSTPYPFHISRIYPLTGISSKTIHVQISLLIR